MIKIFLDGGPIMWPLLVCSIITLATVFERLYFIFKEKSRRQPEVVEEILRRTDQGDIRGALHAGERSEDFVARVLTFALNHRGEAFSSAALRAAGQELKRFNRGLAILDTVITLAPRLWGGLIGSTDALVPPAETWGDTALEIPAELAGRYRNLVSGEELTLAAGHGPVGALLSRWPVALLERIG